MDGQQSVPWSGPSLETRSDFLERMQNLSQSVSTVPVVNVEETEKSEEESSDLVRLENLIQAGEAAEAFFLARSLYLGEEWAEEWMKKAQSML